MPVLPPVSLVCSLENAYSNLHSGGRKRKKMNFYARYTIFRDSNVFYLKPLEYKCWSQAITFQAFFVYKLIANNPIYILGADRKSGVNFTVLEIYLKC